MYWDPEKTKERIKIRLKEVEDIKINKYCKDTNLHNLSTNTAYIVDGVHIYIDILNVDDFLDASEGETEFFHKKVLRFMNVYFAITQDILSSEDVILVDFHNQRLHAVITKPYDDEKKRIRRAIAISFLIIESLRHVCSDAPDSLKHPKLRVGIDSGPALAVNNGRKGHREPLFLGSSANLSAKLSCGGNASGIYLTNKARSSISIKEALIEKNTPLSEEEISTAISNISLKNNSQSISNLWQSEIKKHPISEVSFSTHTPPFKNLNFDILTIKKSRRQEAISIYADIDGFTKYVGNRLDDFNKAKDIVRVLHVIRSELDAVITQNFSGKKIRFIGDCIHAVLADGTSKNINIEKTVNNAILCAGALRDSFELALKMLDINELGLAIGMEYGKTVFSRLGNHGDKIRCCISQSVLKAEEMQKQCNGTETAIGENFLDIANDVITIFFKKNGNSRIANFSYSLAEKLIKQIENNLSESSYKSASALWKDTEDFIDTMFPQKINYQIKLDCQVIQDGFKTCFLKDLIFKNMPLLRKRRLIFQIVSNNLPLRLKEYDIYWKVLNRGEEAQKRNCIRGQIFKGDRDQRESTDFCGEHLVECYIVKDGYVIARDRIIVPIQ